jgi:hypothetical protein
VTAPAGVIDPPAFVDRWDFRDARPRTVQEVLDEVRERPPFLLDGLIHPTATLLTGRHKSGKTHLAAEWIEALTTGQPWCGQRVIGGPYKVLILPTDPGGHAEYAALLDGRAGPGVRLMDAPRPGDEGAWRRFAEDAADNHVGLVVLDTLLGYDPTANINENDEVGVTLARLGELGRLSIPYLVVHHASKSAPKSAASGYLGSTIIGAHFRHLVSLTDRAELKITGNHVAASTLQLIRGIDFRTVGVTAAQERSNPAEVQEARAGLLDEALAALAGAPADARASLRRAKSYLSENVPGVRSVNHAKGLIEEMVATGRVKTEGSGQRGSRAGVVITASPEVIGK